jgi:hypothetical protein
MDYYENTLMEGGFFAWDPTKKGLTVGTYLLSCKREVSSQGR